ncbi:MAG: hypothetical protein ACLRMX_03630 [Lachnospira eligens]
MLELAVERKQSGQLKQENRQKACMEALQAKERSCKKSRRSSACK